MNTGARIGLVQCGHVHADLVPDSGDYPTVFAGLLGPHGVELVTYDVQTGPTPRDPGDCDGWLISGSAASTYDDLAWIAPAEAFVRSVIDAEVPLVGICFGHQLLAQAMGGTVAKSAAGWGAGAHTYELVGPPKTPGWPGQRAVRLIASHQDQVASLPDGAEVIARTDHCPIAGFTLGPRVMALQPHPEYDVTMSRALTQTRYERIGARDADAALASLHEPIDRDVVGAWMAAVLTQG